MWSIWSIWSIQAFADILRELFMNHSLERHWDAGSELCGRAVSIWLASAAHWPSLINHRDHRNTWKEKLLKFLTGWGRDKALLCPFVSTLSQSILEKLLEPHPQLRMNSHLLSTLDCLFKPQGPSALMFQIGFKDAISTPYKYVQIIQWFQMTASTKHDKLRAGLRKVFLTTIFCSLSCAVWWKVLQSAARCCKICEARGVWVERKLLRQRLWILSWSLDGGEKDSGDLTSGVAKL